MNDATQGLSTQQLGLTEELILLLLNEETGYFHQVHGWALNCAVVGAVLAELCLLERIDTDMESLLLVSRTETGDPTLDSILRQIADEPTQHNAQYWIERLASQAEAVVASTLDRLVDLGILKHHDGDFWTLASVQYGSSLEGTPNEFIKTRIGKFIYSSVIPDPRDMIIICLVNSCDVLRFIFELDDEAEERIKFICKMDLIGRSIAAAVEHNVASPLLRRSSLSKQIPTVALRHLLLSPHMRKGNIPAVFADLAKRYGPVFQICPPFKEPMIFLAGSQTNRWVQRHGRLHLRAHDYFAGFEKIYGSHGVMPSWMAAIISGSAKQCRQPFLAGGWKGSWTKSTTTSERLCRFGRLTTVTLQGECAGTWLTRNFLRYSSALIHKIS